MASFVGGTTTYQIALLARVRAQRPVDAVVKTHLVAWAAFLPFFPTEAALWLNLGDYTAGLRIGNIGIIAYAMVHFVGISRSLIDHRRQSDRLAQDLEHLNAELRRQIAERSRELSVTLSRLGAGGAYTLPVHGDVIDDRYRIVERIGGGAMGEVYKVERTTDGAILAMKILANIGHPRDFARFARESQLISELHHPNIVAVVDVAVSGAGLMYMVMEYVAGSSLKRHKERYGDVEWALPILRNVALGLAAIHERGVIHRDIKPDNVLVLSGPDAVTRAKITDFGISTAILSDAPTRLRPSDDGTGPPLRDRRADLTAHSGEQTRTFGLGLTEDTRSAVMSSASPAGKRSGLGVQELTRTGAFLGTPFYMAPELGVGARDSEPSVDIFAFGVMAFEVLTGSRPFDYAPVLDVFHGSAAPEAPSLAARATRIPADVVALVDRSLASNPVERPTAAEFAAALVRHTGDYAGPATGAG